MQGLEHIKLQMQEQPATQPRCACGDGFTADTICANCIAASEPAQQAEPVNQQLLAAAMLAKNSIQHERNALQACHADPRTGLVTDAAGLLALQGYDAILSTLSSAIEAARQPESDLLRNARQLVKDIEAKQHAAPQFQPYPFQAALVESLRQGGTQNQAEPVNQKLLSLIKRLLEMDMRGQELQCLMEHSDQGVDLLEECNAAIAAAEQAKKADPRQAFAEYHLGKPFAAPQAAVPEEWLSVASALTSQYLLRDESGSLYCAHCMQEWEGREKHHKDCPVLLARAMVNSSAIAAAQKGGA